MTNADKYLKDGVDVEELAKKIVGFESKVIAGNDVYWIGIQKQVEKIERFFNQPSVKPTLTEDEKVILRNTNKDYKFIGRDDRNYLYMRVLSDNGNFGDRVTGVDFLFPNMFQFIKLRRRI